MTDTAGMRETLDPVEAEGVAVAHQTAQQADLVLSVVDCSNYLPTLSNHPPETTSSHAITVFNKIDALSHQQRQQLEEQLQVSDQEDALSHQQLEEQLQDQLPQQLSEQLQVSGHIEASGQTLSGSSRRKAPPADGQSSQATPQPPGKQSLDLTALQASAISDLPLLVSAQASRAKWDSLLHPQRSQAVLCSCKTGWNVDVVVKALEKVVRNIMESGEDSQEGLVITRCSAQGQSETALRCAVCAMLCLISMLCNAVSHCVMLSILCHAVHAVHAVPCCARPGSPMLSHAVLCFCSAVHLRIDTLTHAVPCRSCLCYFLASCMCRPCVELCCPWNWQIVG